MASSLSIEVFNSGYKPIPGGPGWDDSTPAGDHFGAGPVLDAFPGAQLMACDQQVVDEARGQTTPQVMASWNSRFAGQFSQSPVLPALASSPEFDLEGHPLLFCTIGGADGALATIVHAPDMRAICHTAGGSL